MAIVLVAVVVAVAYSSAAPTVGVAEFAPAANRELDAPSTTAADDAGAAAASRGRRGSTTTAPSTTAAATSGSGERAAAPTTRLARGRQCFGTPPRQIEDPMSPPCIPTIFEGDNGGTTTAGVNATEIRVAVPVWDGFTTDATNYKPQMDTVHALFEYFNRHFEFYGRRLVPVFVEGSTSTPVQARTKATQMAAQGVFAALTGPEEWSTSALSTFVQSLASDRIVTVLRGASTWVSDRSVFDALHPYVWSVYPSVEQLQANIASFFCSSLAGKPAAFAGDASLQATTRKFGVLATGSSVAPPTSALTQAVSECSGSEMVKVEWTSGVPAAVQTAAIAKLKSTGVTTVLCLCEGGPNGYSQANSAGYRPEWLFLPSYIGSGMGEYDMQSPRRNNQLAPPMRISAGPRLLPIQTRPWFGAIQEVNASLLSQAATTYGFYGMLGRAEFTWDGLLALAAGIQGAGPALTPDSFAAALMSTQFSNPGAGQPPQWQPSVGFGPGDHSLYNDFNVGWWSDAAPALDPISPNPQGSWCYLDQGARYHVGTFPSDATARLFNPDVACR